MNKTIILRALSASVLMFLISCAQHSAPTETSIKLSSYGINNLMTNANHIIVGGIKEDENGQGMQWIESIDPSKLTFSKDLDQGKWLFFGRMFIDNEEHCTTTNTELNQETQKIALDFSKSQCRRAPISSTAINHGVFHFCANVEDEESCGNGKTKSFQFRLLKVSQSSTRNPNTDSANVYYTSNCYQVNNGVADIITPFHLQEDTDLPTVGELVLFSGKGCNGKTQEIEFNHFLIANDDEQARREINGETATFYIKDNTSEIRKEEMNYLASVDTSEIELMDEIQGPEEILEHVEEVEEFDVEEVPKQEAQEETTEVELIQNEFELSVNLIDSKLSIEKTNSRGRGHATIEFNHLFSTYQQVIKLIIKSQNHQDNSTKIYLPGIDETISFDFDENGLIEIDITDYINTPLRVIDFKIKAVGPKAEDQELSFEFYGAEYLII